MGSALILAFAVGLACSVVLLGVRAVIGLWRKYRAEVQRDREWDTRNGITRRGDG